MADIEFVGRLPNGAPITVRIEDPRKPCHGGTWNARYEQAEGTITKDEADRRVRVCRLQRRLAERKCH